MATSLHGFKKGEQVRVHHPSMGHGSYVATVVGPSFDGQIVIRYEGQATEFVADAMNVCHDTPAFDAYLAVEYPRDGSTPDRKARNAALRALHADNRHIQPNVADVS